MRFDTPLTPRLLPGALVLVLALGGCAAESNVFFFDRVTAGTVRMAQAARAGGAFVFFEPSSISVDRGLFDAALSCAHVVKYSVDRIREPLDHRMSSGFVEIQTLGARKS